MQSNPQLPTTPPLKGSDAVDAINDALKTIGTNFSGDIDPAALAWPYATWADTGNMLLKRRNAANTEWVTLGPLLAEMAPLANLAWMAKAIGEPFALRDDLTGVSAPPTDDSRFRYIKLTASDSYNTGALTSESVSGSAPLVLATAVISLADSPLNGKTVNLWNTERRSPRGGDSGVLQSDQFQSSTRQISAKTSGGPGGSPFDSPVMGATGNPPAGVPSVTTSGPYVTDAIGGEARVGDETRVKNQGVTYYMRIK